MSFHNAQIVGKGVNSGEYHDQAERGDPRKVVSSSMLREFGRCPSRWKAGYKSPDSEAKRWGSLVDCLTLTPDQFKHRYFVTPSFYTETVLKCPTCGSVTESPTCRKCGVKREPITDTLPWNPRSTTCQEILAQSVEDGMEVIGTKYYDDAVAACARLGSDQTINRWRESSDTQVHILAEWHDEATGLVLPCQCLVDYLPRKDSEFGKCVGDLKTVKNAHPEAFTRSAFSYGWHIQAAFYLDMVQAALPDEDRNTWCFIVQENYEPWETNHAMFGQGEGTECPGFIDLGRDARFGGYQGLLARYAQCLKTGKWPGYNSLTRSVQGWSLLLPEPWMAIRSVPHGELDPEPQPEPAPEEEGEVVP